MMKLYQLIYVNDTEPGISRKRWGRGYAYFNEKNKHIKQRQVIKRIKRLAIPPAYQSVWICPLSNGHIQATGLDDKNRKQYIYHELWTDLKNHQKFKDLSGFIRSLPDVRKNAKKDLLKKKLCKQKVLATLVLILDETYARVGHEKYTEDNASFGLTTIRKKHVQYENDTLIFNYKGKNQTDRILTSDNQALIKVIKACEELPGYRLFKYLDVHNHPQTIDAHDLNQYLKQLTGGMNYTVKDFRTYAACYETFKALYKKMPPSQDSEKTKIYQQVVKKISNLLGHTQATCKKYYIAPHIFEKWRTGSIYKWKKKYNVRRMTDNQFLKWWESQSYKEVKKIKLIKNKKQ